MFLDAHLDCVVEAREGKGDDAGMYSRQRCGEGSSGG